MFGNIKHPAKRARNPVRFDLRGGSLAALPTPFLNDRIDEPAIATVCTRHVESGTSAIVVCATTGEAPALSYGEQRRVIEIAVDAVEGRVPVIAGAGTCSTASSMELARQAERAGAQALLCITPYYVRPTQEGVYLHMRAIHDAVNIPIILYDVPIRTGTALADATVIRLAELERVIGLKDASGNVARPAKLRPRVKAGFMLLSGDDMTQAEYRRGGGDGCISVAANVAPALCAQMHLAWDQGDLRTFTRIAEILAPLNRALFLETNPIPVKRALHRMGFIADELRLPLTPLSSEYDASVKAAVEAVLMAEVTKKAPSNALLQLGLSGAGFLARVE